jgi:hypothetical protein
MTMLRAFCGVLVASLAACGASSDEPAHAGAADAGTPASLPLLACTPLKPIRDADDFSESAGDYEYPRQPAKHEPTDEAPFATDAEAGRAAMDWIVAHFGPLQADCNLVVKDIDGSASGHDQPVYDWDRGHTVVLQQTYRGIATDRMAVVYIQGRTRFRGTISLGRLLPVDGSERPLVGKDDVAKTVRELMVRQGGDPAAIEAQSPGPEPYLMYVWSPSHNLGTDREILAPNWALDRGGSSLVDAHTGRPWRND